MTITTTPTVTGSHTEQWQSLVDAVTALLGDERHALLTGREISSEAVAITISEFLENAAETQANLDEQRRRNADAPAVDVVITTVQSWLGSDYPCEACGIGRFTPPALACGSCGQRHRILVPAEF